MSNWNDGLDPESAIYNARITGYHDTLARVIAWLRTDPGDCSVDAVLYRSRLAAQIESGEWELLPAVLIIPPDPEGLGTF